MLRILGLTLELKMNVFRWFYNASKSIPKGLESDVGNPGSDPGGENVRFPLVLQ